MPILRSSQPKRPAIKFAEPHWHGATATTAMTHISVAESLDGRNVDWLEHVTDAEYLAGVQ
jgi:hypothetical protein